ncbi:MAG: enoyl-CoA hydratase-related protein [Hyphomicrobiaceae bacterium]
MAEIELERKGNIAHIIFNRPSQRNAMNQAMWRALPGLVDAVEKDDAISVLIVRGVDASAFGAGADIGEFAEIYVTPASALAANEAVQTAQRRLHTLTKPAIAMIQGPCIGGACGLALACDIRFSDPSGRFGITPGRLGIAYSIADTRRLVSAIGFSRARDMLYSGRILAAEEALAVGLIDRLVPADRLEAETIAYAGAIAGNSRLAVEAMKRIIARIEAGAGDDDPEAGRLFRDSFQSADFTEGVSAFLAKRKPSF